MEYLRNVLSALIQNFDTVEKVIETSANSAGSALKENERYLDSIQGKIDQFNNAMQAMWSDTLDSDMVKGFVELATQLVKIVDAIGPLNIALVGFFTYLEKKHGILSNFFKPAEDGVEALKKQLAKAEQDLTKATQADTQRGNKKTAQNRRDAEERVAILKAKIQESFSEAVLDGIDESFDPSKVKKSIGGKKGAITKRAKKLESEGMSFAQIQEDPKIKQWTQEVKEGEQVLNDYNAKVAQADATLKQKNATVAQAAGAERAKAGAEAADASATNAGAVADANATATTTTKTASTWADVWAEITRTGATGASIAATIQQVMATKLASSALVQKGLAIMGVTAAEGASIPVTTMLAGGFVGLTSSIWSAITAMWTFMTTTPIGWILIAVGAVVALGAAFAAIHKTTAELKEELDGFKSELSDIRSELDSVNSELETTNERMEELLAKDKLTFEEQEELDRLRATNDELERRKELLEDEEEYKSDLVGRQAARVVDSAKEDQSWWQKALSGVLKSMGVVGMVADPIVNGLIGTKEDKVYKNIEDYRNIKEKFDNASTLKEQEKYQKQLDEKAAKIDEYILELSEALDGVEYGDSEESDAALDYLAELQDNYAIARGSASAKTNAIKGALRKPEFESMSKALDYYTKALADGDESAADSIAEIINNNKDFVEDLEARGVEAEDAIKHFTHLGSEMSFDTPEKKLEEIQRATAKLPDAFNNIGQFMDGDEVDKTAIAEYFKGTSDKTREEIAKLIQDINDGNIDVENALKKFDLFGVQSVIEIEITEVQTNFKDTFTDLENADGLIDTFQELADAIGSTSKAMDALNAAQAEMDYSGRVSIETALKLMESTDDYSKVLTISEGKLVLAEGAEENLIDARLEGMKASALKALEEAKAARETTVLARETAITALSTYDSAVETEMAAAVTATAWDKVLAAAAGLWAGIKSLFTDESWTEAYDRAYQETLNSIGEDKVAEVEEKYSSAEEQARRAGLQKTVDDANKAIEEQDKEIEKLQGNYDLVSGLNKDNIGGVFKSDDLEDPDAAKEKKLDEAMDRFQREMDYWENRIGANQARYEQLQNEIDLLEAKGQKADASYYEEQIKLENERKWLLEQQKAAAEAHLATLTEGSEEWWEVANTLNDIENELDDVTASIVDLQDAIGEIDTYKFEEFNTRLDNITSKLGTIRDLIAPDGEENWFDEEGNWTEEGVAVLGTYIQELETYKQGLVEAEDAYANYVNEYVGNEKYYAKLGIHSEQELYDKRQELIEQQYDYAQSIDDTEQSVVDMYESNIDAIEEYTETLIDSYNDYIDSVKEALDAERDLYDFKKNVQKQSKDIAAIERRIASLSGSTNASDVAERRKLEAELYESRESLNDTYYDHARSTQDEALDAERTAYEETMNKFIENIRIGLETATANMDEFLMSVTSMVTLNADTVLAKYQETELPLGDAITNPWKAAIAKISEYDGDALELMNKWTQSGFFDDYKTGVSNDLSSPWTAGSSAAGAFKTSVDTVMDDVVKKIETNVQSASTKLSNLYQQILDTENRAAEADVTVDDERTIYDPNHDMVSKKDETVKKDSKKTSTPTRPASPTRPTFKKVGDVWSGVGHTGVSIGKKAYNKALEIEGNSGIFYPYKNGAGYQGYIKKGEGYTVLGNGKMDIHSLKPIYQKYAKGTTGTTRDEWAITDEPQFGDELVLVPGKDGNLSFMRKGTGVVPADMTQRLFELAQIPTSDLMNKNLTAVVPNITKNDFKNEFNFESLVHVDTVDSDTLPKLEKMVDKKIDDFSKALNYSLKRFAR